MELLASLRVGCATLLAAAVSFAAAGGAAAQSFVNFESGLVRPMALSGDGNRLFAVNTPDNRLEIFTVTAGTLVHSESVPVGMDPVAVAVRNASEVWVVNHLSDSVSIVNVGGSPARVTRTLLTCDEPRDIVFAGPGGNRAFITTARRGQNCAVAANLTTAGTPRAIVQVFDATNLGATLAGTPIGNVALFGDTPRALATDGDTVYAAVFHSGNQTTAIQEGAVCDGGASRAPCNVNGFPMPGGLPFPNDGVDDREETALIVKFNPATADWEDELGRDWTPGVRFNLPDLDVFAIDASTLAQVDDWASVGTVLFNMAVNPVTGRLYVSNTEANNEVRFEGPGITHTTVQGHLHEARITVIDGATVSPRHLNKHIDYDALPAPAGVKNHSLATPLEMAVTADGSTLYVAAFGSAKVGIFDTAALENDSFVPSSSDHIPLSGGGPAGLVLNEADDRLYVLTRFDNSISVIDTTTATEIDHLPVRYSPEPLAVVNGRPFLYDAFFTSSNGEASCSSCHVFGDFDSLAWDLGNPDDGNVANPNPFRVGSGGPFVAMKGPMTTQTLRGMATHGPMHWRGDRTGGSGAAALNEDLAFKAFNPAFAGLIGRTSQLSTAEMQAYTDFILTVLLPPNPVRDLSNALNATESAGQNTYFNTPSDAGVITCNGCHVLNPAQGFFGTDGFSSIEGEPQEFKIAHLRNAYAKVGMFGMSPVGLGSTTHQGNQIRGFGFLHDGSIDTVRRFLSAPVFNLSATQEQQLEAFVLAFDSDLRPIVGQQITRSSTNGATVDPRINLMNTRDDAGDCEVIVKGVVAGEARGAVRVAGGNFQTDRESQVLTDAQVRALANTAGQEITFTCVPPGSGERMGVDRDEDGFFDRDELDAGSDPADPSSIPGGPTPTPTPSPTPTPTPTPPGATPTPTPPGVTPTPTPAPGPTPIGIRASSFNLRDDPSQPFNLELRTLSFRSARYQGSSSGVVVPAPGGAGDPTLAGASLTVYAVGVSGSAVTVALPASRWEPTGSGAKAGYRYRDPQRVAGPIKSAVLRPDRLTIRGSGASLFSLSQAPQGTMALRLELGSGPELCAAAPARSPAASNDNTARFVGVKPSAPPAVCPAVP